LFVLLAAFGRFVALVFNDDATVVANLVDYLRIVPLSYGLLGVLVLANATLNALNRPLQSALLSVLRLFVLYVPLAMAASALLGLQGIFGAAAVANVIAGLVAFLWLRSMLMGGRLDRPVAEGAMAAGEVAAAGE
jgi:Na+-driven multidrug efflux pump